MFAVTPRLLLRPGWAEDAEALHHAIADEAIVRNLARAPWPYTKHDAEEFMQLPIHAHSPRWLIFERGVVPSKVTGCIGIDLMDDGDVELGYWIGRTYWNRGYATEAGRAALANAKSLGYDRVVASHFSDNPASGRVLRKLGFMPTGRIIPRFSKGRGVEADTIEYAVSLADCDKKTCDATESDVMRSLAA